MIKVARAKRIYGPSMQRLFETFTHGLSVYSIKPVAGQCNLATITIIPDDRLEYCGYYAFVSLNGNPPIGNGYSKNDATQAVWKCILDADTHNRELPAAVLGLAEVMRIEKRDWIEVAEDYGYTVEKII